MPQKYQPPFFCCLSSLGHSCLFYWPCSMGLLLLLGPVSWASLPDIWASNLLKRLEPGSSIPSKLLFPALGRAPGQPQGLGRGSQWQVLWKPGWGAEQAFKTFLGLMEAAEKKECYMAIWRKCRWTMEKTVLSRALIKISCVTSRRFLNIFGPQFSYLRNPDIFKDPLSIKV